MIEWLHSLRPQSVFILGLFCGVIFTIIVVRAKKSEGYHSARVQCNICTNVDVCVYPSDANECTLECSSCGARDSVVIEYIK